VLPRVEVNWTETSLIREGTVNEIGAFEAKTKFSELLRRAQRGERFVITKHGAPVAVLEPPPPSRKEDVKQVIATLKAFRKRHSLRGLCVKELIEAGRL